MKRNSLTILVGILLLVIFTLLLFTFQVRQTEIALVTTFDKPSHPITKPGFYWQWPPPIQKVYKLDNRVQTLEPDQPDKIDEMLTKDSINLVMQVYMGWRVQDPELFFSSFPAGTIASAQVPLEDLVRSAKNSVIGTHPFTDFVSSDPKQLKFSEVEKEIMDRVAPVALKNYGVEVKFLGIKKLGLPESVTQKVFDRMAEERKKEQASLEGEGVAAASKLKANADAESQQILAEANAQAMAIKGKADADAASYYTAFNQDPQLANFIFELRALEEVGREKATYFLDPRTAPFNLLTTNYWQRIGTNQMPYVSSNSMPMMESKITASKDGQ